jgi:hypothetical protein
MAVRRCGAVGRESDEHGGNGFARAILEGVLIERFQGWNWTAIGNEIRLDDRRIHTYWYCYAGLTMSREGKKDDGPFVVDRIIDGFVLRHPWQKDSYAGAGYSLRLKFVLLFCFLGS